MHVWVEAYVDYVPSRGRTHIKGDTWIPMDGSFKQYTYTEGEDLSDEFPFDAEEFMDHIIDTTTINEEEGWFAGLDADFINNTFEAYHDQADNYIDNATQEVLDTVIGKKEIVLEVFPFLSATLQNKTIVRTNRYTEIPDNLRHKVSFEIFKDSNWGTQDFAFTKSLSELAGKKITLSFVPATQDDQTLIDSLFPELSDNGSITIDQLPQSYPAYLINMKPELRVAGEIVATGSSVVMGSESKFNMSFFDPSGFGNDIISNITSAGEYYAIVLDIQSIAKEHLESINSDLEETRTAIENQDLTDLNKEDIVGNLLYTTAMIYFSRLDNANKAIARKMGLVWNRLPSEGIFSTSLDINYSFLGVPLSASPVGFGMDVDYNHYIAIPNDNNIEKVKQFGLFSGILSSALEHWVPEQVFSTEENPVKGISAAKALQIANAEGKPIYNITQDNIAAVLPQLQLESSVINDIQNAVNAGKEVVVSKTNIEYEGWTGCGYIILDPETGSGAYMISGGKNGSILLNLFFGLALALLCTASIASGWAPLLIILVLEISAIFPAAEKYVNNEMSASEYGVWVFVAAFFSWFGGSIASASGSTSSSVLTTIYLEIHSILLSWAQAV